MIIIIDIRLNHFKFTLSYIIIKEKSPEASNTSELN